MVIPSNVKWLCCTYLVRDYYREFCMLALGDERTHTADLQDREPGGLQRGAQASWLVDNPLIGTVLCSNAPRVWFDRGMNRDATLICRRGRQQTCGDAAVRTYLAMKALIDLAWRLARLG